MMNSTAGKKIVSHPVALKKKKKKKTSNFKMQFTKENIQRA